MLLSIKGIFPSDNFYKGKLITSEKTIHDRMQVHLDTGPYMVYDLQSSQEIGDDSTQGIFNPKEAEYVLGLCSHLVKRKKTHLSIGIITPYQRQVQHLKDLFSNNHLSHIEIGTVDGYQGREKDIIIFSSVRARSSDKHIGFLTNRQRLNVSLTRARHAMYIVCHAESLRVNEDWRRCIENARQRNLIRQVV